MTARCPNRQRRHTPSSWTTPNPDTTLLGLYFQQPARGLFPPATGLWVVRRGFRYHTLERCQSISRRAEGFVRPANSSTAGVNHGSANEARVRTYTSLSQV